MTEQFEKDYKTTLETKTKEELIALVIMKTKKEYDFDRKLLAVENSGHEFVKVVGGYVLVRS